MLYVELSQLIFSSSNLIRNHSLDFGVLEDKHRKQNKAVHRCYRICYKCFALHWINTFDSCLVLCILTCLLCLLVVYGIELKILLVQNEFGHCAV